MYESVTVITKYDKKIFVTSDCVQCYKVMFVTMCDKILLQVHQVFHAASDITTFDKIFSPTVLVMTKCVDHYKILMITVFRVQN